MQGFIVPEELNTLLATENAPFLLVFLDKKSSFSDQQQTLEELLNHFGKRLRIALLDIEYQNTVTEKFKVHGFPAFIFCEQGKKKDVLLGTPDAEILREFVIRNLPGDPLKGYEPSHGGNTC
jgi:thioredoxin-like negative regulator of GroEL